jgi:hypothetical protein
MLLRLPEQHIAKELGSEIRSLPQNRNPIRAAISEEVGRSDGRV